MHDATTVTKMRRRLLAGMLAVLLLGGLTACDLPLTEPGSCSCAPQLPPTAVAT